MESSGVPNGDGGPHPPFFQNMILEICPKMKENFSRRAFPRIFESLKGVVQKYCQGYAPRSPTIRVLDMLLVERPTGKDRKREL